MGRYGSSPAEYPLILTHSAINGRKRNGRGSLEKNKDNAADDNSLAGEAASDNAINALQNYSHLCPIIEIIP